MPTLSAQSRNVALVVAASLFMQFLDGVIIVVTGDHGLRNEMEFESLGERMMVSSSSFNVPFILYAPGLLGAEIRLPYATSHIDIAPTLLDLNGFPVKEHLFHGENMLDSRLAERVHFLMNTAVSPTDGYLWKGRFFTYNNLTGAIEIGRDESAEEPMPELDPPEGKDKRGRGIKDFPAALRDPKQMLARAKELFRLTARQFAEKRLTGAHEAAKDGGPPG